MPINNPLGLGYTAENISNKDTDGTFAANNDIKYPSEKAAKTYIDAAIANIPNVGSSIGSFLLSGGGVVWVTGYQFDVSAAQYYIQGVLYSSIEQPITLSAADGTFDRIDVITVDTSGNIVVVEGIPSSSPSEPAIDPSTQLKLAFIIVYAGSTSPILTSQSIYEENAGSPTEWNWSSTGSTWNLGSTNNPYAGTKDIEATSLGANAYAQGMATGTVDLSLYTQLNFRIRSKATWNNGRGLYVNFYSNGVKKGNDLFIAQGFFNFNSSNTADYQLFSIPLSQFAIPNGTTINQIRFSRVGGAIGFYLDNIGITNSGLTPITAGLTQEQADARYIQRVATTDNAIIRADGAIGDVQSSLASVNDSGGINIPVGQVYMIGGTNHAHSGTRILVEFHTGSASATLDFISGISALYDIYEFEFLKIRPSNTSYPHFQMRFNTGSGFDTGTNYQYIGWYDGIADVFTDFRASAATSARLAASVTTSANFSLDGSMKFYLQDGSLYPVTISSISSAYITNSYLWQAKNTYLVTTPITQVRFFFSAGNIESGEIRMYGITR